MTQDAYPRCHIRDFQNQGHLIEVLIIQESCYLADLYWGVPYLS